MQSREGAWAAFLSQRHGEWHVFLPAPRAAPGGEGRGAQPLGQQFSNFWGDAKPLYTPKYERTKELLFLWVISFDIYHLEQKFLLYFKTIVVLLSLA